MRKSILWCTGYHTKEFCQQKAREIREKIRQGDPEYAKYERVALVDKVVDYVKVGDEWKHVQYNRIRLFYKQN